MGTLAPSGTPKLSEVARHLIMPDGIVSSDFPLLGPQIERMGTPLDRWQQGLCQAILAKRENGMYACGIGGAVVSIPRQVGKTYTIGVLIFALCAMNPDMLVLWSAHRARTDAPGDFQIDGHDVETVWCRRVCQTGVDRGWYGGC